jgi:hypothetical protein
MYKGLPNMCFSVDPMTDRVIVLEKGVLGYFEHRNPSLKGQDTADNMNADLGVSKAQAEAMLVGSMFGWDVPGADPERYGEDGKYKKEK